MAIKKKISVKLKTEDNDLDIRLANAWLKFKKSISEFADNVDECTVELHFESSEDTKTHYQFEPDEAVFLTDVVVAANNQVRFTVPFGAKNKSFHCSEAELIKAKYKGEEHTLNNIIAEAYKEAFAEVPEAPTITMLERKYLATNVELRELFNNVEFFLKERELQKERDSMYSGLDTFGMF